MRDKLALLVISISTRFGQSSIETYLRIPSEPQVVKIEVSLQPNRVAATPSISAAQDIDTEESDHSPSVMSETRATSRECAAERLRVRRNPEYDYVM